MKRRASVHRAWRGSRLLLVAAASLSFAAASGTAGEAKSGAVSTLRADVVESFDKLLCASGAKAGQGVDAASQRAWRVGLFDAQVEGRKLEPFAGQTIALAAAQRKARSLAGLRRFGGHAAGLCPDGTAWAVALPSPEPLKAATSKGRLTLPTGALTRACASYRVDYAASAGGAPRSLASAGGGIDLAGLAPGAISVTCQPKAPRWQGPVLWFLRPVGDIAATPPEAAVLASTTDTAAALGTWVNRVRAKEGLPALAKNEALAAQAGVLAVDGDLSHNRELLRKISGELATKKVRLLGEDRVRAADVTQMAWLLWTSPRHRSLILQREATTFGIALRALGTEQLAVLIVATQAPLTTAGKPAKKKG